MPISVSLGPIQKIKEIIKLHTLSDLKDSTPSFISITEAGVHEVNILGELIPEAGATFIMDRGYLDFERLYALHQCASYFVVRAKTNTRLRCLYSMPVDRSCGLRCDQIILPTGFFSRKTIWQIRECREDPNMDRHICVCVGRNYQKTDEIRPESLHNFTNFKYNTF